MTSSYSTFTEKGTCFKIVIVGERAVGKTSLAVRYVKGIYSNIYAVTVGIEFYSKMITQGSDQYQLQLWDTVLTNLFRPANSAFKPWFDPFTIRPAAW
jgi:Ras-related protein Rab-6A